jgi:hypothetical protein
VHVETQHLRPDLTYAEMKALLTVGWGNLGKRVGEAWLHLNKKHFAGKLRPLPITIVSTSPYGRWTGLTYGAAKRAHLIQLTVPREAGELVADRGVLLHEMIHQYLLERSESPIRPRSAGVPSRRPVAVARRDQPMAALSRAGSGAALKEQGEVTRGS